MRKLLRTFAPMLALLLVPTGASAATQTWTYVAAAALSCGGGVCSPSAGGQNFAPLGAFQVTPTGTSITFDVDDAAGPGVSVSLCQENKATGTDAANLCGDGPDDVQVSDCSTGSAQTKGGFTAGNPVLVSIFTADIVCEGIGTTGTAKVTF